MSQTVRPPLVWILAVAALLAAAVVGVVSWVYAYALEHELLAERLVVPEHVGWMYWFGVILMLLGGVGALALLLLRHRRLTTA
ncbi:hypothetical protein [Arsenicicoccus sp. oral taxon 190]|uniref:hypothetical protein n=1 Tax=Arsenicicoccus sp. oral taxon 190 TaxID=1658671 RepID=UPI000679FA21|nr:hypothetical protein [Arsenicicoccus sp. oral taxon 190]AKT51609.1 hypothetical protein ADJ73_10430 [Arsenicicoccus sp. oral taxon 190]